ncbi:undecaprenyldiphospho-muramoylpentapeptide beta-N-acetylglucosaminyltransferase [Wolbachia endosymbiont of Ctenocephalides felis wCfeT]|uniref:undecaprenyldiphospho-muramoylpentapeptide beta-N-acetylglucosaminyltransferase n=1 Tax=Wolbachia endosymbiont of Ctenocephalides felis wCfeT TaxID=2732593 RepID=UPI0014488848|nr:undecaprenyldiphospho-muramoylpentapeptide beta-N-acetylglucosaminyltransferase [Wolbachia endosymbiont of Ctenocephalides felis wCfeT]
MNIILATGGTGGHIFPAIALAKELNAQGYNSILFTDKQINTNAESYILMLCKSSSNKFKFFFLLMYSSILALYKMKKLKPKIVIGFGSYASFPSLLAARILSIPIILHEQNTVLGRVNRFFSKSAKLIATSFPETKYAERSKCVFTGNFVDTKVQEYSVPLAPIPYAEPQYHPSSLTLGSSMLLPAKRCHLSSRHWDTGISSTKITDSSAYEKSWIPVSRAGMTPSINILITAGSQGANLFDNVISSAICTLPSELKKKIKITQQCTGKNINKVKDLYKSEYINCELSEFFNDMKNRLANAHLVISRAGATSIAEITLTGRPAIYIPYPHSKDDHQLYNAKYVEDFGAAVIVEQNGGAEKNLTELLTNLLNNPEKLHDMAGNTEKTGLKNGIAEFMKIMKNIDF